MKKNLEEIRTEAIDKIVGFVKKYGGVENALMLCDFDFGDSPIVKEDIYDGNLSETLDTIILDEKGNLQFHCGSAYKSSTYTIRDIDTDTLVGIADWLEDHIDEEEWAGEEAVLTKCPFCESENIELVPAGDGWDKPHYHCKDCDRLFDKEEYEREELRHQLSPLLNGTSEEKPLEIFFNLPSAEEEAQGLSSLEIPAIDKVFELEGDGTMWYHTYQHIEGDDWHDIDELAIGDLKALVEYIRREI